ncbi:hypothetical protein PPL_09800 [Heterostelium album PN500]|uniref:Uncharacterized protein n=1 Tax=Heterostelium pallidum (strain ATCC 26659 / Pp 5 / PN500) TaxID=670386 RepID=D3BP37_HETP5|nr:hypothetical protein PPL_09800 [Heterostelium album PN500]EFA77047.1 hypothetical protein PPL_09800 [Heterostelium album PN500]|eukprot:XP_020429177.1 hypothetical protein PPL_09800 [Heterostelium album PN500]
MYTFEILLLAVATAVMYFINKFTYFIFLLSIIYSYKHVKAPYVLIPLLKVQNLRTKYNAKWAIVTGASSGIGECISRKLAEQQISVVLVSNDEARLQAVASDLKTLYKVDTRIVVVDLRENNDVLLREVRKATDDIDVQLVFNNAGYIAMEGFHQSTVESKLDNLNCNAINAIRLTDHFYKRMLHSKQRGAIVFTSSSASVCPSPYSVMYSAGKALLTSFAESLSIESRQHGIDILAIQPGYVRTKIFDPLPKLALLNFLRLVAQEPVDVVNIMFKCVGRLGMTVVDSGFFAFLSKMARIFLGGNLMTVIIAFIVNHLMKDMEQYRIIKI